MNQEKESRYILSKPASLVGVGFLVQKNGQRRFPVRISLFPVFPAVSERIHDLRVDLDTHGMFICTVTEARVVSDRETMTYTYYQNNVKPKPEANGKKGFVCKVCGYVYEGDELPEDFVCPLCKHGAADFEPLE